MKRYIETWIGKEQLLGSDFTTVIRTKNVTDSDIKKHIDKINNLKGIKPSLKKGYYIEVI